MASSNKISLFEDISSWKTAGSRHDQLATFSTLFNLYSNSFFLLFQETKSKYLLDILKLIQYSDELSANLANSQEIVPIVHFVTSNYPANNRFLLPILEIILKSFRFSSSNEDHNAKNLELFEAIMPKITENDLELSEVACVIVETFISSQTPERYLEKLVKHSVAFQNNNVMYLRYASIVSKILSKSDELFEACVSTHALNIIWSLCQSSDDLLSQIVALEYVRNYALTKTGFQYLFSSHMFQWLISIVNESIDHDESSSSASTTLPGRRATPTATVTADPMIVSSCLREISAIFHHAATNQLLDAPVWENMVESDSIFKFLRATLGYLDGHTDELRLTGLSAIADFASSSPQALATILQHTEVISAWCQLLNSSKVEMQGAALHSMAQVFAVKYHLDTSSYALHTATTRTAATTTASASTTVNTATTAAASAAVTNTAKPTTTSTSSYTPYTSTEVQQLKRQLWNRISETKNTPTMIYLLKQARNPFAPVRHGTINVLTSIVLSDQIPFTAILPILPTSTSTSQPLATPELSTTTSQTETQHQQQQQQHHSEGLQLVSLSSDFRAYLIDQESEQTKEGREWKYGLVHAIATHPSVELLVAVDEKWVAAVKQIHARGPYYVPPRQAELLTAEL